MNYFWFSYKQATCFDYKNIPKRLYYLMSSLPSLLYPSLNLLEQAQRNLPNTILVDGKRVTYTEWTTGSQLYGNWDDYIFVHKCKDFPKGIRINDPLWKMYIPSKYRIF